MRLFFVCPPAFAKASAGKPGAAAAGAFFLSVQQKESKSAVRASRPSACPFTPRVAGLHPTGLHFRSAKMDLVELLCFIGTRRTPSPGTEEGRGEG